MPALENARHELFAQAIAKGSDGRSAYKGAGYQTKNDDATDAAASRLLSDVRVRARVAELKERAAGRTVISIAGITTRLLKIAEKGEASEDAPLLGVARQSLMDAAKLNGLIVDKSLQAVTSVEDLLDRLDSGAG